MSNVKLLVCTRYLSPETIEDIEAYAQGFALRDIVADLKEVYGTDDWFSTLEYLTGLEKPLPALPAVSRRDIDDAWLDLGKAQRLARTQEMLTKTKQGPVYDKLQNILTSMGDIDVLPSADVARTHLEDLIGAAALGKRFPALLEEDESYDESMNNVVELKTGIEMRESLSPEVKCLLIAATFTEADHLLMADIEDSFPSSKVRMLMSRMKTTSAKAFVLFTKKKPQGSRLDYWNYIYKEGDWNVFRND